MSLVEKIRRHGLAGSTRKAHLLLKQKTGWNAWRYKDVPHYANPTSVELEDIERGLVALGITLHDYSPATEGFKAFKNDHWFPDDYHGGQKGGVWDEKLLEHWISSERLGLMNFSPDDIYVDVAAAGSPWALTLRERKGLSAYAIDLCEINEAYRHLPYYRVENATNTAFEKESVKGISLHCAYEMFTGEDDISFIHEAARILQPGGKVVILPLYMHTHYCAYSTPEYFGKGYSDQDAKEYIRLDCNGIPSSRKYDPAMLKQRVLDPIEQQGLHYHLMVLRNKPTLGNNIYCHFILEIMR